MTLIQAIVLGAVQGLSEFLPISSSAHLVLVPWLLGWEYQGLIFDVGLHLGTLAAVVTILARDWILILKDGLTLRGPRRWLLWYIALATIPGAAVGFFLEETAATVFRSPIFIGIALILSSFVLALAEQFHDRGPKKSEVAFRESVFVGLFQAFAIIPGISRSGSSIMGGLFQGLSREAATRFSFLLATPLILGAGVFEFRHLFSESQAIPYTFWVGMAGAAFAGLISMRWLLRYVRTNSLMPFVYYRIGLGILILVLAILGLR